MKQRHGYPRPTIASLEAIIAAERARVIDGETRYDENGEPVVIVATCGTCGESWNDAIMGTYTPAPSGRCPFEYVHAEIATLKRLKARR